jgi:hypothetical protein
MDPLAGSPCRVNIRSNANGQRSQKNISLASDLPTVARAIALARHCLVLLTPKKRNFHDTKSASLPLVVPFQVVIVSVFLLHGFLRPLSNQTSNNTSIQQRQTIDLKTLTLGMQASNRSPTNQLRTERHHRNAKEKNETAKKQNRRTQRETNAMNTNAKQNKRKIEETESQ